MFHDGDITNKSIKPPYQPGDILYVRETFASYCGTGDKKSYLYKADLDSNVEIGSKWRPSIHMPKEAARIFLRVTDIRVERLQEITTKGAVTEGTWGNGEPRLPFSLLHEKHPTAKTNAIASFAELWDRINWHRLNKFSWDANPWVWVIEFERLKEK